jgi:hypothetical protein
VSQTDLRARFVCAIGALSAGAALLALPNLTKPGSRPGRSRRPAACEERGRAMTGGRDGRDRGGRRDREETSREGEVYRPRRPAPGKIASTALIGNPDPPRWYRPAPGKRTLTMRLPAEGRDQVEAPSVQTTQAAADTVSDGAHGPAEPGSSELPAEPLAPEIGAAVRAKSVA